jgi:arylsulfatase
VTSTSPPPTADEFFGSLYHLNAEDEPEHPDYFKDPELRKRFGTRGVIRAWANPDGTQKIETTGPLTKKRMETVDEDVTRAAIDFLQRATEADKPFFLWWNSTRMHIWTRLKRPARARPGSGSIPTGWSSTTATSGRFSTS